MASVSIQATLQVTVTPAQLFERGRTITYGTIYTAVTQSGLSLDLPNSEFLSNSGSDLISLSDFNIFTNIVSLSQYSSRARHFIILTPNVELSDAWKSYIQAITITRGNDSITLPGPANSYWTRPDTESPYNALFSGTGLQELANVIGSSSGNRVFILTFDDGVVGPPTTVEADAGGPYRVVSGETVALFGAATVENASGDTTYAWARNCLLYTSPSPRDS